MRPTLLLALAAAVSLACSDRPDIPFAPKSDKPLDFAAIERDYPLTPDDRRELDPKNVESLTQQEVDQVYVRLTSGPIPDGAYRGNAFFSEGAKYDGWAPLLARLPPKLAALKLKGADDLGELLWKGKKFYRDRLELRNIIQFENTVAAALGADANRVQKEVIDGKTVGLLFPAKLSCGASLLDPRRPSVIIDYADNSEITGYIPEVDSLVGKNGLAIRDEIRMVRPGFYLGRAYLGNDFALNFTLYDEAAASSGGTPDQSCAP